METIVARYGEVQGRFEELDGYALGGRREVSRASASREMMDGDMGACRAAGRCAWRSPASFSCAPTPCS
jgi:hypothetical protein